MIIGFHEHRDAWFRKGDRVREGMHVGTVTDVGTMLIRFETSVGAMRMVCPWELAPMPASEER
jgi:hypothetical protein